MKTSTLILLSLATATFVISCKKKNKPDNNTEPVINVAMAATDSIVLHKEFPGYLKARTKAEVVGEVNGRLLTQNFQSGAYVTKGQVLFTIEPTSYRDAVEEAQASLTSAISQRDYYKAQSEAMQRAYEQEAVSKMELLQSQTSLRQAEASIRNASATLENARTRLSKCTVHAPISGYITLNEVSPGNYISGEGSPQVLATIYDNSIFDAIFSVESDTYNNLLGADNNKESTLLRNMPLKFQSALPHSYTADLYYVAPSVSSSTGSLELAGTVRNIDNELKEGMYVMISLPYGIESRAVIVKDAAISSDQLGKYMYVVNDSDKVVYTPVTVGPVYRDSLRVIEKGIKPGDRYVTQALLTVRNGQKVKPRLTK